MPHREMPRREMPRRVMPCREMPRREMSRHHGQPGLELFSEHVLLSRYNSCNIEFVCSSFHRASFGMDPDGIGN